MTEKLMLLRVQLYGAMQTLKDQDLAEFWKLMDEIQDCRTLFPPPKDAAPKEDQ